MIPIKFEFTKQEIEEIKSKIYLTDLQEKILDLKLKGDLTEYGMAIKLGVSESTITYQRLNGLKGSVGYVSSLFPDNVLLITMKGHIVCSKYGVIYDTFDCRDRQVEDVWLVK